MEQKHPTTLKESRHCHVVQWIAPVIGVSSRFPGWSMRQSQNRKRKAQDKARTGDPRTTALGSVSYYYSGQLWDLVFGDDELRPDSGVFLILVRRAKLNL
ncbi:hypothetical protein FPOAC2_05568 [Fusarium poae]|jgi:hypothetical protein